MVWCHKTLLYSLCWSMPNTMSAIQQCGATALFDIFQRQTSKSREIKVPIDVEAEIFYAFSSSVGVCINN